MPIEYRQKKPSELTQKQRQLKKQKDDEYEVTVQNLSAFFVQKKRTVGVTPQEEVDYKAQKRALWNNYKDWAISEGLYEIISPDQQLAKAENRLNEVIEEVNRIRLEMDKPPITLREAGK